MAFSVWREGSPTSGGPPLTNPQSPLATAKLKQPTAASFATAALAYAAAEKAAADNPKCNCYVIDSATKMIIATVWRE